MARWPGHIAPGSTGDEPVCLIDLMATVAALVGYELPPEAAPDSYNILPALLSQTDGKPIREAIVHHSGAGMFSLRQGRWKLIQGLGSGGFSEPRSLEPTPDGPQGQLYDMWEDTGEGANLWLRRPELVKRLSELLERYRAEGYSRPGAVG